MTNSKQQPLTDDNHEQGEGRKEGNAKQNDAHLHGEHTARAPELGTNSLADKQPKGDVTKGSHNLSKKK
jgi:hypothetical protein